MTITMGLFTKRADPISDRARTLNQQIAHLESEIKKLSGQLQQGGTTKAPVYSPTSSVSTADPNPAARMNRPAGQAVDPIFEPVNQSLLSNKGNGDTPDHYNDLGVRKYDLPALLRRVRNHFKGPSATNPKLVSYLAAGGIQGLRPLRYEKRVARNRFIFLVVLLFLMLLGLIWVFVRSGLH